MLCCAVIWLQEEELKAAMDKAVEAETCASEAELRMKEMKVNLAPLRHCLLTAECVSQQATTLSVIGSTVKTLPRPSPQPCAHIHTSGCSCVCACTGGA